MRRFLLALLCSMLFVPSLLAHPVPKTNRDRIIVVRLTPNALVVEYRLELDEANIAFELPTDARAKATSRAEFLDAFCRYFADIGNRNLDASLNGKELLFKCVRSKYTATDHVRCDYRFEAPWSLKPGVEYKVKFKECNYITDDFSRLHVYLAADGDVRLLSAKAPDAALMARTSDERRPGDSEKLRRVQAQVQLATIERTALNKPAFPPDDVIYKDEPDDVVSSAKTGTAAVETLSKAAPTEIVAFDRSSPGEVPTPTVDALPQPTERPDAEGTNSISQGASTWDWLANPNLFLDRLLDTPSGIALALFLMAILGAVHALQPGHGKTLVAAYLVGERGTLLHAVVLGLVTTMTHTGAVLVLGVVILFFPGTEKQVLALQGLIGGTVITALGLWMVFRRLTGQADHFHIGGGHHHHHGGHHHDHDNHTHDEHGAVVPINSSKTSMWQVVTLGMAGGMLPCVEAVVWFLYTLSIGKGRFGLPVVLAFSVGLATVLVGLGIAVVGAKNVARRAASSSARLDAIARTLPLLSAIFITVMGLWLCYGAFAPTK